jgi:Ras-related protein Rab-1A
MALEEKKDENELEEDKFIKNVEKINDYQLQHKYLFPICLLGEAGVGKTSLLTRFCDNSFKERYNNTIGVDFRVITLKYKNIISKIHIWDTAGQERFRSLALNYINNSQGFIFVYDITNRESFNNIENWVNLALEKNNKNICNFLVGNKTDKEAERKVSVKEGEILAKEKNFFFLETSAKTDDNVQKLFYYCLYRLIEYYKKHEYIENSQISLSNSNTEEISTMRQPESKCSC